MEAYFRGIYTTEQGQLAEEAAWRRTYLSAVEALTWF